MKDPGITENVIHHKAGVQSSTSKSDILAREEPLEIRIVCYENNSAISKKVAVTMRTPGFDKFLSLGFLFTEGILQSMDEVESVSYIKARNKLSEGNVIQVTLKQHTKVDFKKLQRNFYTSSSCGVCGKASIEAVETVSRYVILENKLSLAADLIYTLPEKMLQHQAEFDSTGGLHAAALFGNKGNLIACFEDIGRHNALDKVVGKQFSSDLLPLDESILLLSGRLGFELVQKSMMAGIPIVAAVGAPSTLSLKLARKAGITLIGFLKKDQFNIYCHPHRIK